MYDWSNILRCGDGSGSGHSWHTITTRAIVMTWHNIDSANHLHGILDSIKTSRQNGVGWDEPAVGSGALRSRSSRFRKKTR